ncbi:MAG: DUF4334 domain-containing protein [Alcanivoracaceae bacterium]|nr:DUF4334 domain-containing protein [Alcanivoracaceae bacterium]
MSAFNDLLAQGLCEPQQALDLFDSLEPVALDAMIGQWRGAGFHTNHPMDGLLETFNWYGKNFIDTETVHPLVCLDAQGNKFSVDPCRIPMSLAMTPAMPRNSFMGKVFQAGRALFSTTKPRARLRMTELRGKVSATMIYDHLPINDVFRKVDDNTLFGLMDMRGFTSPFFFVLYRA